jgi:hypothetical protein
MSDHDDQTKTMADFLARHAGFSRQRGIPSCAPSEKMAKKLLTAGPRMS